MLLSVVLFCDGNIFGVGAMIIGVPVIRPLPGMLIGHHGIVGISRAAVKETEQGKEQEDTGNDTAIEKSGFHFHFIGNGTVDHKTEEGEWNEDQAKDSSRLAVFFDGGKDGGIISANREAGCVILRK